MSETKWGMESGLTKISRLQILPSQEVNLKHRDMIYDNNIRNHRHDNVRATNNDNNSKLYILRNEQRKRKREVHSKYKKRSDFRVYGKGVLHNVPGERKRKDD